MLKAQGKEVTSLHIDGTRFERSKSNWIVTPKNGSVPIYQYLADTTDTHAKGIYALQNTGHSHLKSGAKYLVVSPLQYNNELYYVLFDFTYSGTHDMPIVKASDVNVVDSTTRQVGNWKFYE